MNKSNVSLLFSVFQRR